MTGIVTNISTDEIRNPVSKNAFTIQWTFIKLNIHRYFFRSGKRFLHLIPDKSIVITRGKGGIVTGKKGQIYGDGR